MRHRTPAGAEPNCSEILSDFISESVPTRYQLSDFPELDYQQIERDPKLKRLVELHDLPENQDQSKIILALLIQKNPELDADGLIKRYTKLYYECE